MSTNGSHTTSIRPGLVLTLGLGICLLLLPHVVAFAQGPRVIAIGDRHLWPERVNAPNGFDKASRAAILVYAQKLQEQKASEFRQSGRPSVVKWLDKELALSLSNYQLAAKICAAADWTCLGNISDSVQMAAKVRAIAVPANLLSWKANMVRFVSDYIGEQVRLAALFTRTTSEIDLFNPNEFDGDRLPDRKFFLTFDDGPTSAAGNTDGVLQMLAANKKTAVFFLLGGSLKTRMRETAAAKLASSYQGQCVASHGWEHLAHATSTPWKDGRTWQTSVTDTQALLTSTFADSPGLMPLFRPPYGQRRADSSSFFQEQGLHVTLWDLDSQDWNASLNADDVTNRIENLMLIKRHGILLFHDIFHKAKTAVPTIIQDFATAIDWANCHQISEAF